MFTSVQDVINELDLWIEAQDQNTLPEKYKKEGKELPLVDPLVGVIEDGPVIYLVLNDKEDFVYNLESLKSLENAINHIQMISIEGKP
jgi:hypothetical protein